MADGQPGGQSQSSAHSLGQYPPLALALRMPASQASTEYAESSIQLLGCWYRAGRWLVQSSKHRTSQRGPPHLHHSNPVRACNPDPFFMRTGHEFAEEAVC
eukprot:1110254-Amphidinium_carterae.1